MNVTIIVATYGSPRWHTLAAQRAVPSALEQGCPVVAVHGRTLAEARNSGVAQASTEWLIHLDADDTLDPGVAASVLDGTADLRVPPLLEMSGPLRQPVRLAHRHIEHVNPCHVGTGIRRETLLDCGGWPQWRAWEDWALFLRAYRRGASVEHLPAGGPAYVAHTRSDGRNATVTDPAELHDEIRRWA